MTSTRNALGRGIGALIPNARPRAHVASAAPRERAARATSELPVAAIDPNPDQPRRDLRARARSTRSPTRSASTACSSPSWCGARATATSSSSASGAGARRSCAGLDAIPAVVPRSTPRDRLEVALVENVQRQRSQSDRARDRVPRARRHGRDAGRDRPARRPRSLLDREPPAPARSAARDPGRRRGGPRSRRSRQGAALAGEPRAPPPAARSDPRRAALGARRRGVRAADAAGRGGARARAHAPGSASPAASPTRCADCCRRACASKATRERGRVEIEYFGAEDLRSDLGGAARRWLSPSRHRAAGDPGRRRFEGTLVLPRAGRIDGRVAGAVLAEGDRLGRRGGLRRAPTWTAIAIVVEGTVEGNVYARTSIELAATGA